MLLLAVDKYTYRRPFRCECPAGPLHLCTPLSGCFTPPLSFSIQKLNSFCPCAGLHRRGCRLPAVRPRTLGLAGRGRPPGFQGRYVRVSRVAYHVRVLAQHRLVFLNYILRCVIPGSQQFVTTALVYIARMKNQHWHYSLACFMTGGNHGLM